MRFTSEQMIESLNKREKAVYACLYDLYYASLCHYASCFIGKWEIEEDIVQDIFIKLWEKDVYFENKKALSHYLFRAVHNSCLFFLRGLKEKSLEEIRAEEIPAFDSPDNEKLLLEEEYYCQLFNALKTLSDQRRLVVEKTLEGKTNEEIAAEMNISVNTVKTLKRKAYIYLRKRVSPACWVFFVAFL